MSLLHQRLPNLRVGLVALGNYDTASVVSAQDLTTDPTALARFMQRVGPTGSSDYQKAYEQGFKAANTSFNWGDGAKVFVLLADATPHEKDHPGNVDQVDWRLEVQALAEKNVAIFGVCCFEDPDAHDFILEITQNTSGSELSLPDARHGGDRLVSSLLLSICHAAHGMACNDTAAFAAFEASDATLTAASSASTAGASLTGPSRLVAAVANVKSHMQHRCSVQAQEALIERLPTSSAMGKSPRLRSDSSAAELALFNDASQKQYVRAIVALYFSRSV